MLALGRLLYRQCHFPPLEGLQLAVAWFPASVKAFSSPLVDLSAGIVKYP